MPTTCFIAKSYDRLRFPGGFAAELHKFRTTGSKLAAAENVEDQPESQDARDHVAYDAQGRETKK
jgi:hypothetical protein